MNALTKKVTDNKTEIAMNNSGKRKGSQKAVRFIYDELELRGEYNEERGLGKSVLRFAIKDSSDESYEKFINEINSLQGAWNSYSKIESLLGLLGDAFWSMFYDEFFMAVEDAEMLLDSEEAYEMKEALRLY